MRFLWSVGELWKVVAGVGAVAGAHALWWWADRAEAPFAVYAAALGLGAVGAIVPFAVTRCPGCGFRPLWEAVAKRDQATGLEWLFALEACPECGLATRLESAT